MKQKRKITLFFNFTGLYIIEFPPPPRWGGGEESKGLEGGKKIKGGKRQKKKTWGKNNFWQYQIINTT